MSDPKLVAIASRLVTVVWLEFVRGVDGRTEAATNEAFDRAAKEIYDALWKIKHELT